MIWISNLINLLERYIPDKERSKKFDAEIKDELWKWYTQGISTTCPHCRKKIEFAIGFQGKGPALMDSIEVNIKK